MQFNAHWRSEVVVVYVDATRLIIMRKAGIFGVLPASTCLNRLFAHSIMPSRQRLIGIIGKRHFT